MRRHQIHLYAEEAAQIEEEALSLLRNGTVLSADDRQVVEARFRHRMELYRAGLAYTES